MGAAKDEEILRLNAEMRLIPEERLRAAQEQCRQRAAEGHAPPDILELLVLEGEISPEVERRYRERLAAIPLPTAPRAALPLEVIEAQRIPRNCFGHFVLLKEVGRGGMGSVHRAWDTRVNRIVALKIILGSSPDAVERFVREAQIAGRLRHPSIATVYEAGETAGRHYIAMQFIEGAPIDKLPRPMDQTLRLIRDAARALHYAHGEGVIHRDIKPSNLLVDAEGNLYVTDFGTAKEFSSDTKSHLSYTSTIIGTPQYMSPEQIQADTKRVDARSDVYSLGATLYCLLAGRPPFDSPNIGEILVAVMRRAAPSVRIRNHAASPELDGIIQRALSKDSGHRFKNAHDFAEELDRIVRERRYAGRYGLARYLGKKWIPRIAVAILFIVSARFGFVAVKGLLRETNYKAMTDEEALSKMSSEATLSNQNRDTLARKPRGVGAQGLDKILVALKEDRFRENREARILRLRIELAKDAGEPTKERLAEFGEAPLDYRLQYLTAVALINQELAAPPPLPDVGGPDRPPEWLTPLSAWRDDVIKLLRESEAAADKVADSDEQKADLVAIGGLVLLVTGNHAGAASQLAQTREPFLARSLRRARYLSGDDAIDESAANVAELRESEGALLRRAQDQHSILVEREMRDPEAEAVRRALLAMHDADEGLSPDAHVVAGLAAGPKHPEIRASLLATRARWLAVSNNNDLAASKAALALLPAMPSTSLGKLARVEALIASASVKRRLQDGRGASADIVAASGLAFSPAGTWPRMETLRSCLLAMQTDRRKAREALKNAPGARARIALADLEVRDLEVAARRPMKEPRELDDIREQAKDLRKLLDGLDLHADAHAVRARSFKLEGEAIRFVHGREPARPVLEEGFKATGRALEIAPGHVDALLCRKDLARWLARWDEAFKAVDALKETQSLVWVLETRALLRYEQTDFAGAIADWTEAMKHAPDRKQTYLDNIESAEEQMRTPSEDKKP